MVRALSTMRGNQRGIVCNLPGWGVGGLREGAITVLLDRRSGDGTRADIRVAAVGQAPVISDAVELFPDSPAEDRLEITGIECRPGVQAPAPRAMRNEFNIGSMHQPSAQFLIKADRNHNAHALSTHGAHTTLKYHYERAMTPRSDRNSTGQKRYGPPSTRFMDHDVQATAMKWAMKAAKVRQQRSQKVTNGPIEFEMKGRVVGEGFYSGSGVYATTSRVRVVFKDGKIVTAYPVLPKVK